MSVKKYEVLKDFYLIQVFYPKGSILQTEEVIAKQYVDLEVLKEKEEPQRIKEVADSSEFETSEAASEDIASQNVDLKDASLSNSTANRKKKLINTQTGSKTATEANK